MEDQSFFVSFVFNGLLCFKIRFISVFVIVGFIFLTCASFVSVSLGSSVPAATLPQLQLLGLATPTHTCTLFHLSQLFLIRSSAIVHVYSVLSKFQRYLISSYSTVQSLKRFILILQRFHTFVSMSAFHCVLIKKQLLSQRSLCLSAFWVQSSYK